MSETETRVHLGKWTSLPWDLLVLLLLLPAAHKSVLNIETPNLLIIQVAIESNF